MFNCACCGKEIKSIYIFNNEGFGSSCYIKKIGKKVKTKKNNSNPC